MLSKLHINDVVWLHILDVDTLYAQPYDHPIAHSRSIEE
jgi:hypothetical protein